MRAIAARAGLDPVLIHHYFGNNEKLFFDVVQLPYDTNTLMAKVHSGSEILERLSTRANARDVTYHL